MKNITRFFSSLLLTLFFGFYGHAQLDLGDLAIVGYNSDISPDEIAFVALAKIPVGQTIYISDYGWTGSAFSTSSTTNGAITWTITTEVPAGTLLNVMISTGPTISGDLSTYGTVSGTGWTGSAAAVPVASGGDSWLIYQGASPTAVPTNWVFGFANWSTSSGTTAGEWRTSGSATTTTSY